MNKYIGVLDSGVGGLDILNSLKANLKDEDFYFIGDNKHVPYGSKTKEQIVEYGITLAKDVEAKGAKMIVIACNTLSLNAIDEMRKVVDIPIYGIARPTVKGFLNYDLKSVLILATKATVNSHRYVDFLVELDPSVKVYQQVAPKLVDLIEANKLDEIDDAIKEYVDPYLDKIDAVILGCTHYPIVVDNFNRLYPNLVMIDSRKQMVQLVNEKLDFHKIRSSKKNNQKVIVEATGSIDNLVKASKHFFDYTNVELRNGVDK